MSQSFIEPRNSNILPSRHESDRSDLASVMIKEIIIRMDHPEQRAEEIRLSSRLLILLSADPDVDPIHQKVALIYNQELRQAFPTILPRMYRTGLEIFAGRQIIQRPQCSICTHIQRNEIDQAIRSGVGYPEISLLHSVSESALARHKKRHLEVGDSA